MIIDGGHMPQPATHDHGVKSERITPRPVRGSTAEIRKEPRPVTEHLDVWYLE